MGVVKSSFGGYQLERWPHCQHEKLQAWDAADEYLLEHVAEQVLPGQKPSPRVLLINDSFGALACALHNLSVTCWSDSIISRLATAYNREVNELSTNYEWLPSTAELSGSFDIVLMRVPKSNALLEDQLCRLRPHLHSNTVIVAAAMIKHLPRAAFSSLEKIIGPLTTSLARKKARLLFATLDESMPVRSSPYPDSFTDDELGLTLTNHANVFSRNHLDHGARFLLSHFSKLPWAENVIDLGCGNGVLGIVYQQQHPQARVQFIDESFMAVESARINYKNICVTLQSIGSFDEADGLTNAGTASCDLVLCNPPFHQQYVVGGQVAASFFRDASLCLSPAGELWVIANRHLPYQPVLKRLFGNCQVVASNKKFAILRAVKR